jgi:hypothetical protein
MGAPLVTTRVSADSECSDHTSAVCWGRGNPPFDWREASSNFAFSTSVLAILCVTGSCVLVDNEDPAHRNSSNKSVPATMAHIEIYKLVIIVIKIIITTTFILLNPPLSFLFRLSAFHPSVCVLFSTSPTS